MSEFMKQAKGLQDRLNNDVGRRFHPVAMMDDVLDRARRLCHRAEADHVVARTVTFPAILHGENVTGTAEVVFAAFGEGDDTVWVAFGFYQDGWANAVLPFTLETADMKWLEDFVTIELAG